MNLLERCESREFRESCSAQDSVAAVNRSLPNDSFSNASFTLLEQQLGDISEKLERVSQDTYDSHARLEMHEERLKVLRLRVENKEEHYRVLSERVERADWENRFEQTRQSLQEVSKEKLEDHEKIELIIKRLDYQDQVHE